MSAPIWIGVIFAAVLVGFLMFAFLRQAELTSGQHDILRFLGSLCAGASAAFLVGGLTISGHAPIAASDIGVTATGGVALFLIVWWGWGRSGPSGSGIAFNVGKGGHTFASTAEALAQKEQASVQFNGFSEAQKNTELKKGRIAASTTKRALELLGTRAVDDLPKYKVEVAEALYTLTAEIEGPRRA